MSDGRYARFRKPLSIAGSAAGLLALVFIVSNAPTLLFLERGADEAASVADAVNRIGLPGDTPVTRVSSPSTSDTRPLVKNVVVAIPPGSTTNNPVIQAVTGYYDIGIPQSISLPTASSTVAKLGVQVVYEFPSLHVLVARLNATQQATLTKNSSVSYVQPVVAALGAQADLTSPLLVSTLSPVISPANPVIQQGSKTVAIVDDFNPAGTVGDPDAGHGYEVLSAYQAQCAATNCGDPNPTLISALDPLVGYMTGDSIANGAIYAIDNGAKIINMSTYTALEVDADGNGSYGGPVTDIELNLDQIAQLNNVALVYCAGNDPNYVQPALNGDNPYAGNVITVGALVGPGGQPASYSSVASEVWANGVLPSGADGTSFAAPRYAATLDANMHNNGEAYPSQDTIAETDNNTPGFLSGNEVIVERNPDNSVESVTSTQAAVDSESDDDDGNPDFATPPSTGGGTTINPDGTTGDDGTANTDENTNVTTVTAQPGDVNTGTPSNSLTVNPDDPTSQAPVISPDNTPTTPDTNSTYPITTDSNGNYSVTVTPTTPVAPAVTPPDDDSSNDMQSLEQDGANVEGPPCYGGLANGCSGK